MKTKPLAWHQERLGVHVLHLPLLCLTVNDTAKQPKPVQRYYDYSGSKVDEPDYFDWHVYGWHVSKRERARSVRGAKSKALAYASKLLGDTLKKARLASKQDPKGHHKNPPRS